MCIAETSPGSKDRFRNQEPQQILNNNKIKLTPEYLIEKNFHMIRAEWLWRDDNLVEVTLKQLCDYISDIRDVKDITGCNKVNC